MRYKTVALAMLGAAALVVAPLSPASAHEHFRGRGVAFGLAAAVVGTAAFIATAPFRALAAPVYAAPPQPVYYAPPQAYYAPPPQAYYAPPPVYYVQPQAYYAPPGYYPR
jgi:hypothetical protein